MTPSPAPEHRQTQSALSKLRTRFVLPPIPQDSDDFMPTQREKEILFTSRTIFYATQVVAILGAASLAYWVATIEERDSQAAKAKNLEIMLLTLFGARLYLHVRSLSRNSFEDTLWDVHVGTRHKIPYKGPEEEEVKAYIRNGFERLVSSNPELEPFRPRIYRLQARILNRFVEMFPDNVHSNRVITFCSESAMAFETIGNLLAQEEDREDGMQRYELLAEAAEIFFARGQNPSDFLAYPIANLLKLTRDAKTAREWLAILQEFPERCCEIDPTLLQGAFCEAFEQQVDPKEYFRSLLRLSDSELRQELYT